MDRPERPHKSPYAHVLWLVSAAGFRRIQKREDQPHRADTAVARVNGRNVSAAVDIAAELREALLADPETLLRELSEAGGSIMASVAQLVNEYSTALDDVRTAPHGKALVDALADAGVRTVSNPLARPNETPMTLF